MAKALNRSMVEARAQHYKNLKRIARIPRKLAKQSQHRWKRAKVDRLFVRMTWSSRTFYPDQGEVSYRVRKQGIAIRTYYGAYSYYPTAFVRSNGRLYYRNQRTKRVRRLKGEPRLRGDTILGELWGEQLTITLPKNIAKFTK